MRRIFTVKKIILVSLLCFVGGFGIYITPGVVEYRAWTKAVEAQGSCPWFDAGEVLWYLPVCILDTPPPPAVPVTCAISCTGATTLWGPACVAHTEMAVVSQLGTPTITPPLGFVFLGSPTPTPGAQYMACGASPAMPWVIALPSPMGQRVHKFMQWYDYVIASVKGE